MTINCVRWLNELVVIGVQYSADRSVFKADYGPSATHYGARLQGVPVESVIDNTYCLIQIPWQDDLSLYFTSLSGKTPAQRPVV